MYRGHFGLSQLPFRNTPDFHFFYEQASRRDILDALTYVIRRGDPLVKVTGEVGCGKTTILRLLADSLDVSFKLIYINSPNLSPKDLLFHIADELSLTFDADLPKFHLLKTLRHELVSLHAQGKHVLMLVDEAQAMSFDTLEEVRLLSNLETNTDKLIQIVLFGQPELDVALAKHQLRQLKDRISYSIHVPPLTALEVQSYLNYRMRQASYKDLDFFNAKASKLIHSLSGGLPRSINTIADQLLMAVFGAGDKKLKRKHFKNLSSENLQPTRHRALPYLLVVAILLGLILWVMFRFDQGFTTLMTSSGTQQSTLDKVAEYPESETAPASTVLLGGVENADAPAISVVTDAVSTHESRPKKNQQAGVSDDSVDKMVGFISSQTELDVERAQDLVKRHYAAAGWLNTLAAESYVIQLATFDINDYLKAQAFYKRYKILTDSLFVVIDMKSNTEKFRIKFLYVGSDSYSQLIQRVNELPDGLKKSQPFITPVHLLHKTIQDTEQSLDNWEMS